MRKETEDETQCTTKIGGSSGALKGNGVGGGGGLEPITNYRIKHVHTHFFIVVNSIATFLHLYYFGVNPLSNFAPSPFFIMEWVS
jgi:hypothetical protein